MSDFTGKTLQNNYFLRQHIGKGATADVYLTWDKARHSELAVKVLHRELAGDSRFIRMFKKEAEFMRELRHPNIVRLFDFGEDKYIDKTTGKIVFIVMDYIKGPNLRGLLLERKTPFTIDETSQVLAAVCKALYFAHQSKILHCDVKPANILISYKNGEQLHEKDVFLADFGISHWALQQKDGGTPAYMAPELFKGDSVNEQTDIYALGVTLYEMLSGGELPYRGETGNSGSTPRERIAWEKANKPLPSLEQFNPSLSKDIIAIVEKALNKDPKFRHTSVIEIWKEFEHARNHNGNQISDQKTVVQPIPPQFSPRSNNPPPVLISSPGRVLRANQPHLLGQAGERTGQVIPIAQYELTIGRSINNNLRLADPTVSRTHAIISTISGRVFYIQDQDSGLGTYLNGRKIPAKKPILLKEGDRIEIGNSNSFIFRMNLRTKG